MRGGGAEARGGLDLQAVAAGWLLGTGVLLAAGLALALAAWQVPAGPGLLFWGTVGAHVLAGLMGGLRAGGRAVGSGLLHGLLTGLALAVVLALADSVRAAVPAAGDLLRTGGTLVGAGAMGGIIGANVVR